MARDWLGSEFGAEGGDSRNVHRTISGVMRPRVPGSGCLFTDLTYRGRMRIHHQVRYAYTRGWRRDGGDSRHLQCQKKQEGVVDG